MEYKKINNINICIDDISKLRLLQSKTRYALSGFYYGKQKPKAIVNCSYFTTDYVLGRNQGDMRQDTSSFKEQGFLGFALKDDCTYVAGDIDYWDVTDSACGFTPATISILNGEDVELASTSFVEYSTKMNYSTAITMFGILSDKRTCLLITAPKGISGYTALSTLKKNYEFDFLCSLDGGGSSQMYVLEGEHMDCIQASTDATPRRVFNGLSFIKSEEKPIELMYPCKDGWGSQDYHTSGTPHYGIDIGWTSEYSTDGRTPIYASADGEIVFEGIYPEVFSGKTYYPIGVVIKHNFSDDYDYYTIYWHLSSTCIDKGMKVKKGDKIGVKGSTGYSGGTHLHFQMIRLKRGQELPKSYDWKNYSIDPKPFITVYDDIQLFVYKDHTKSGDKVAYPYDLKHSKGTIVEPEPIVDPTIELNEKIATLEAEIVELNEKLTARNILLEIAQNGVLELQEKIQKVRDVLDE